ncbi:MULTISPECIES: hypothetical protein [unclassified Streptomyces]|uniref:hypothetical protein n=1 Tax=unclassified Streptomyces TaxID=2593676 RepID=UPI00036DC3AF|nr:MULTISPECIES: hypothetical protein [unclassified Streptomyces]MYY00977.1 hypothetical protein [Streptomyces sp. SID4913]
MEPKFGRTHGSSCPPPAITEPQPDPAARELFPDAFRDAFRDLSAKTFFLFFVVEAAPAVP